MYARIFFFLNPLFFPRSLCSSLRAYLWSCKTCKANATDIKRRSKMKAAPSTRVTREPD